MDKQADTNNDKEKETSTVVSPPTHQPHKIDMAMLRKLAARGLDDSEGPDESTHHEEENSDDDGDSDDSDQNEEEEGTN